MFDPLPDLPNNEVLLLKHLISALSGGSTPFVGALDAFESVIQNIYAPSWRLLSSYAGPLVRVRRSSDNAESDINADPVTGYIDTAALSAFIGGGSAFVAKVYNQKGSVNLENIIASQQPTLSTSVTQWDNKTAMVFDGSDDIIFTDSSISPTSMLIGGHCVATDGGLGRYVGSSSGNSTVLALSTGSTLLRFGNTNGQQIEAVSSVVGTRYEMYYNGASSIVFATSEVAAIGADLNFENLVYALGAFTSASQRLTGSVPYFITLNAFLTSPERTSIRSILAAKYPS